MSVFLAITLLRGEWGNEGMNHCWGEWRDDGMNPKQIKKLSLGVECNLTGSSTQSKVLLSLIVVSQVVLIVSSSNVSENRTVALIG